MRDAPIRPAAWPAAPRLTDPRHAAAMTPFAVAGEAVEAGEATIYVVELFVLLIAAATVVALADPSVRRCRTAWRSCCSGLADRRVRARRRRSIVTPELVLIVLVPGPRVRGRLSARLRRAPPDLHRRGDPGHPGRARLGRRRRPRPGRRPGCDPSLAFIVGAIVSATDPVSVIATFKSLGAPNRLATLVEAESLFNDGTAVVVFSIAVAAATGSVDPPNAVIWFASTLVVSAGLGLVTGVVATRVMAVAERPPHRAGDLRGPRLRHVPARRSASGSPGSSRPSSPASSWAPTAGGSGLARRDVRCARPDLGVRRVPAHGVRVPAHRPGDLDRRRSWTRPG